MSASQPDYGDKSEATFATSQLHREELAKFIPVGLTLLALFCLGFAIWDYLLGHHQFSMILTSCGALSVVLLVAFQINGKRYLQQVRVLFGLQIMVMTYLFLIVCKVDQTGLIGALCMVPVLVAVAGFQLGGALLLANLLVMLCFYQGLMPWQISTYSDQMWIGFLGAYAGLGIYVCALEYYRDGSRTKLVSMSRQFNQVASLDQLTELPNRREMERLIGGSLNRYHLSGEAFSIIIADVDNYKHFNDNYGHQFGDQLLMAVGRALHQGLRSDDIVARWGGDEFLVLMRGQKLEAAQQVAERLRRAVSGLRMNISGDEISVTMSFGVACIEGHEDGDDLISTADRGLYQAKHMGRDMVVVG